MVFRKPYGFLIKHFKLIHLLITGVLVYLVSLNNNIYSFLNSCIKDSVNKYNALDYVNYGVIWVTLLGIFLFYVIYRLFKYKDKPRNLYVISMIGYGAVGIFMLVLLSYVGQLPINIIEQKVIRAYRDIMLITLGYQYLMIMFMFIRGLGFDIKKFNFGRDIQELNLSDVDSEEVEVNLNIDTTKVMREVRKQKREFGYFFKEYKIFILGILFIVFIFLGFKGFGYFSDLLKIYHQGDTVGTVNYITVNDSYYSIDTENDYVVVRFDVFKDGRREKLNVSNMILVVDGEKYLPDKNICHKFNRLGNCYKQQYVTKNKNSYVLAYKVDGLSVKKTYLLYKDSYEDTFKIKLDMKNYE